MRTYGKNDFKDFQYVKDDNIGKFYKAIDIDLEEPRTILIVESEHMSSALKILNEGFLYNNQKHKNILQFYGAYLNEILLNFGVDDEDYPENKEEQKSDSQEQIQFEKGNSPNPSTYQVGIITEYYSLISLQQYFNYYQNQNKLIEEDKIWLILNQMADVLGYCQKKKIQHNDLRPNTIYIRDDHKTVAMSHFGQAKLQNIISKDSIAYLAPKIYNQSYIQKQVKTDRNYKDDVFSLGLITVEMTLLGFYDENGIINDAIAHLKENIEQKLSNVFKVIQSRGYSDSLIQIIESMLQIEEDNRVDFLQLRENIRNILGKEKIDQIESTVTLKDNEDVNKLLLELNCQHCLGNRSKNRMVSTSQSVLINFDKAYKSEWVMKRMKQSKSQEKLKDQQ